MCILTQHKPPRVHAKKTTHLTHLLSGSSLAVKRATAGSNDIPLYFTARRTEFRYCSRRSANEKESRKNWYCEKTSEDNGRSWKFKMLCSRLCRECDVQGWVGVCIQKGMESK